MNAPRAGTHCARLLAVLADGKAHSTSALHRRAGNMIVHSRIAELRKRGYRIEHTHIAGRVGAKAHRYQWLDAPAPLSVDEPEPLFEWEDLTPRDAANRYRIYRVREGEQQLMATCATAKGVGTTICTLGAEDEWKNATVGVLDTNGDPDKPGRWLLNPYEPGW